MKPICLGLLAVMLATASHAAEPIVGIVEPGAVSDGDTFALNSQRIRLSGCDAPETAKRGRPGQPFGDAARDRLRALVEGREVVCTPAGRSYDRVVARCTVAGRDLCSALVADGLAWDEPLYSRGRYREEETSAACLGLGLWAGSAIPPWAFRHCEDAP
jgi:endonuclease YncB( thermonuclease family)